MATQYTAGLSVGQVLTAATMNSIGAASESWTPVLKQGTTTFTVTVNDARYMRFQKLVIAWFGLTVTAGTGQVNTALNVSLPITAVGIGAQTLGNGWIYDASATTAYHGAAYLLSTTTAGYFGDWSAGTQFGVSPAIQFTTNDQLRGFLIYEAA